jgi:4-hydroxyphenylpyruvate dioxygenase
VHAIAFLVDDARSAFTSVVSRGAAALRKPSEERDSEGEVTLASVAVYGETIHAFVERGGYAGPFLPGYVPCAIDSIGPGVGLDRIDHVVANVDEGALDEWVEYYRRVFGFTLLRHFDADAIHTAYSALASTVVWNGADVVLPINEPAPGLRTSQITEYLRYYGGPGIQHLALATGDILTAVRALRARGIRFLEIPPEYYVAARERLANVAIPWAEVEELGILVDEDEYGYLLQIFTENLGDRPTIFLEIIERQGARGFGEGNFRALFEAIERAQARRGNL